MKKLFGAILLASSIFVLSCSHGNDDSGGSSDYDFSDRDHFLVLTNDSNADIPFSSIPSASGGRSIVDSNKTIINSQNNSNTINIIDAVLDEELCEELLKNAKKYPEHGDVISANIAPQNENFAVANNTTSFKCYLQQVTNGQLPTERTAQNFILKKSGNKCNIWVRTEGNEPTNIPDSKYDQLATDFDLCFNKEIAIYGSNVINIFQNELISANENTKINILVYDISNDGTNTQNRSVIGGLFSSLDLFKTTIDANSNAIECIHVDSYLLQTDVNNNTKFITSTLIHEFQHLLHYINKSVKVLNGSRTETWYNEMMSLCAEEIFQSDLGVTDSASPKSRLSMFNANYYVGFRNWNNSLEHYANVYAFGAYLMRNYGGIRLIHEIATNNYVNEASITAAIRACGYNEDFTSVLHKFGQAIIYPTDSSKATLYKGVGQNFNGVDYSLAPINLFDYWVAGFSESTMEYIYDSANRRGNASNGTIAIKGPIILNAGASWVNASLGAYGTHVIYLGKPDSAPSFDQTSGVTQTIIIN